MNPLKVPQALRFNQAAAAVADVNPVSITLPGLKLGQVANLLLGFKAGWVATDASTAPFFPADSEPLKTADATITAAGVSTWGLPRITLHEDTNSLLSGVFPYSVQALTGDTSVFSAPSGPLLAGDIDSAAMLGKLSEYLGVDLLAGYLYMLVEQVRTSGTASRAYVAGSGGDAADHLTPGALTVLGSLSGVAEDSDPQGRLSARSADLFVKSFQAVGTHYVSHITGGDRIFQVFAYKAPVFAEVKAAFLKSAAGKGYVEGLSALPFQYYTTPRNSETGVELGYVSGLGKVNIVSADPVFAASITRGDWFDANRAGGNNIFESSQTGTKVEMADFTAVVPIAFQLTPLGNLIPVDKSAAGRNYWNRLLKGSLLQKYGKQVSVAFPAANTYRWRSLLPNSGPWLSTIATPSVNVYDAHLELGTIQLTNRAAVKKFDSWSVVLEAGTVTAAVPGDAVSISSFFIQTSGPGAAPTVQLASLTALRSVSLACGRMDGAITIGYAGGPEHKVVMDGVAIESSDAVGNTGRSSVKVTGDLFGVQDPTRLTAQASNLNFSIVTCQTLLYSCGSTAAEAQALSRDCLAWLAGIIPDDESISQELAVIRLRAAYLANVARRLDEMGVTVPYLTYSAYRDYISAMSTSAKTLNDTIFQFQTKIDLQRNAELTAKTADEINRNIKASGQLLTDYIAAVAVNQGDIATNYQGIITTKQRELQSAVSSFAAISKSVSDQTEAVREAKIAFEFAMRDYEVGEIIKAVINISVAFVTVGIAIVTPSATIAALADLGETAQKIQKLITVLGKIMDMEKLIEGTVRNIVSVTRTLAELDKIKLTMPSSQEWSEMSINFDTSLATVPPEVAGPKAAFSAAFKILVLRAQAMLTAQSKIAQLNSEIALNQAQEKINKDQQVRLAKLTQGLNLGDTSKAPDVSEVDLLSLTGHVQSQLNQTLGSLAQAMILQSSAVQFELLARPTQILQFDLSSLQAVMASQQANIIDAKNAFNPPPFVVNDPIRVLVRGVPVSTFTGGNTFEFQIQPSETQFQPYNMVRVQQVTVDIPAIKGSKAGQYRIDLAFEGNPFEDRNAYGDPLLFNTVTRHFGPFTYNAADHKLISGDQTGSIGNEITRITPFSTWQITMPKMDVNQDLNFGLETAVDIVLSFRIVALAQPALIRSLRARGVAPAGLTHTALMAAWGRPPQLMRLAAGEAAAPTVPAATLDDMLEQMFKAQGVLKGWDCVLNMLEEPVNRFLEVQYGQKYPNAKPMVVTVGFCQPISAGSKTILAYTRFSVNLGPPLLAFQANNHNYVAVTQVIQQGYLQTGSKTVPQKNALCPVPLNLDDPTIEWGDKEAIDVSKKPTITGTVGLGMVQGLVQPKLPDGKAGDPQDAHSVILDFAKGSFVARDLNIDTDNATLNLQLSNWFVTNPIQYLINTVVFNDATTLKALQPTSFKLNVLTTNSTKNVLQVFITTSGTQQSNLTINVNEPIPDGYHNSLMINTKIMFQDIFVQSFNKGSSNLQVASVDPVNDYTAWAAKVTSGTVSGAVTFDNTSSRETRINANGNTITWPLDGLLFSPTKDQGVNLNYHVKRTVDFQVRQKHSTQYGSYWGDWNDYSVDVDVTVTGTYPLSVSQAAGKQDVQISSAPPHAEVTPPDLHPTGPCECNDNDLKIRVGEVLRKQVPAKLQDSMAGIKFSPVSVFALYNLLFPTDDFIEMKLAYVPGDMVVVGTFNKYVTGS
jgi:hypothetical protein